MSPIPLGILAVAGSATAGAFELISSTILTSNTASVTFSAIPDEFAHLQIRMEARTAETSSQFSDIDIRFNGDTSNSYSRHELNAISSVSFSYAETQPQLRLNRAATTSDTTSPNVTGYFAPILSDVFNYSSSSKFTNLIGMHGSISADSFYFGGGTYNSNAVVTSLTLTPAASFLSGSRFSLYGVRA